jgi:hypothetical protein
MSLQLNGHGDRNAVIKKIQSQAWDKDKPTHGTDEKQFEAVRNLVVSEINALPEDVNGVRVVCEAVAHGNGRTIQINIFPQKLDLS